MYLYKKTPCSKNSISVDNSPYGYVENSLLGSHQENESGDKPQIKILLVDDHQIIRSAIRDLIKEVQGMEVAGEATDGKEAINLCRSMAPDIVLMDVNMPRMNGIEATRKITSVMPDIHIIGLSMHHENKVTEKMKEAGASAYLSKTEIIESLVQTIWTEVSSKYRNGKVKLTGSKY